MQSFWRLFCERKATHYFTYLRLCLSLCLWTKSTCVCHSHCTSQVGPRGKSPVGRLLDGYPRLNVMKLKIEISVNVRFLIHKWRTRTGLKVMYSTYKRYLKPSFASTFKSIAHCNLIGSQQCNSFMKCTWFAQNCMFCQATRRKH